MPQTKTRIVCTQLQISSWFFRNRKPELSKNGFCPQTRLDAQFEQMIHGTAFKKRFPCLKVEKMPDKTSRKSTALSGTHSQREM